MPEEPGDPTTYTSIQQRIYNELLELKQPKKLIPQDKKPSRKTFLSIFTGPIQHSIHMNNNKLKRFSMNFTILSPDIVSIQTQIEFKVKFTPNDNIPACSQCLPTPINLKDDITVEVAVLHKNGKITTLPISKYASPDFAQREFNGRFRFRVGKSTA